MPHLDIPDDFLRPFRSIDTQPDVLLLQCLEAQAKTISLDVILGANDVFYFLNKPFAGKANRGPSLGKSITQLDFGCAGAFAASCRQGFSSPVPMSAMNSSADGGNSVVLTMLARPRMTASSCSPTLGRLSAPLIFISGVTFKMVTDLGLGASLKSTNS